MRSLAIICLPLAALFAGAVNAQPLVPPSEPTQAECLANGFNVIVGTNGNDNIEGTDGPDCIFGLDGDDNIDGLDGDDIIIGGPGDDHLDGDGGDDTLFGGPGENKLHGKEGNDIIVGGPDNDEIKGDDGDDIIFGGAGDDKIEGKDGNDYIDGGDGDDDIKGDKGNDTLIGGPGDDDIDGGDGDDSLDGGAGTDDLKGGNGDDNCINGTAGADCENLTPARLVQMSVERVGDRTRVSWETSSESGLIGFVVRRGDEEIGRALTLGALGGRYELHDDAHVEGRYTLSEMGPRRRERSLGSLLVGEEIERPRAPLRVHDAPSRALPVLPVREVVGATVRTPGPGLFSVQDPALVASARAGQLRVTLGGRPATWRLRAASLEVIAPRATTGFAAGSTFVFAQGTPTPPTPDAVERALERAAQISRFEQDLFPGLVAARDPSGDPWFWRGLGPAISGAERARFPVSLPGADGESAMLHISLHGASDALHRAVVLWNGAVVDEIALLGREPARKTLVLDAVRRENTLELIAVGAADSAWYLDAFEIERAVAGVVDQEPLAVLVPAPLFLNDLRDSANAADYLILTPREFREGAERLAALRASTGWNPKIVELDEVYDAFSHSAPDPRAVHALLEHAYLRWTLAPRALVVLGAGTFDYQDRFGAGGNLVPPPMLDTPHGLYAADATWGELDAGRAGFEVAVGRLPARDAAELERMIDKVARPLDLGAALLVSDRPELKADYAADLDARVAGARISSADLDRDALRDGLFTHWPDDGLVVYAGHGGLDRWSDDALLTTSDASALPGAPVVVALTCSTGRAEIPGVDALATALLRADGGARAYLGAAGVSNHYDAMLLLDVLEPALRDAQTLGDAWLDATARHQTKNAPFAGTNTYQWFGDPGLPLRPLPASSPVAEPLAPPTATPARGAAATLPTPPPAYTPDLSLRGCSQSAPSSAFFALFAGLLLWRRRR